MFGSGVGPGGGGIVSVASGALAVRSATTVWADWVWMAVVSWVGAGVASGAHALRIRTNTTTRLIIRAFLFIRTFILKILSFQYFIDISIRMRGLWGTFLTGFARQKRTNHTILLK
jgi:hypothetical protein